MRKLFILLFAALASATVCLGQSTAAPTNQPDSPRIKPPTAAPGNTASNKGKNSVEDMLIAREKEVWEMIRKKDIQGFSSALAEDQLYVTGDGVHTKAETVKSVAEGTLSDFSLDEWKVLMLDKDMALVTYKVSSKGTVNGQEVVSVTHESTIWAKRGGKWVAVFHQDTTAT
ncbi:MAG TPA: nuclear transport factor 2 family protein [Pyrinomonadaceae bacterium]|jgi:hypothetical protein